MAGDDAGVPVIADLDRVTDEAALFWFRENYPDSGVTRFSDGRRVTWSGRRGDETLSAATPEALRRVMRGYIRPDLRLPPASGPGLAGP